MEPVNTDFKDAVLGADKFLSITLTQENLSPAAEKERSLLAQKFKNLKTQFGFQSDLPGGGKAPPRPPKGGIPIPMPVTNGDQEGQPEELYDDVAGVIADDQYYSPMAAGSEEEPKTGNTDTSTGENYEIMSGDSETTKTVTQDDGTGEDYMAMDDDTAQGGQEDYEEPQQNEQEKPASAPQDEEYEIPGADTDYEVTGQPSVDGASAESDSTYEGVGTGDATANGEGSVDGRPVAGKERSGTLNLESLTKNTKPENIEGVIRKGFLNKHRKEGKVYIGSRYQKRYCVVRNHMLYYFKDKKSPKQQGYILLPGYKVATANKRGREFTLTHSDGHRSFQFETNSKEEAEEWMTAIQAAADAPLSERHSADLNELRDKQPSDGEDSMHYEDTGQNKKGVVEEAEETFEDDEAMYDDTNEDLYEEVGSVQPVTPSQQSSPPIQEINYEISGPVATSPKPAEPSAAKPIVDEDYELPGQTPPPPTTPIPAPPPPRPAKSQPLPPQDDNPPAVPPPRPSKPQPPPPPVQDDTYEVADTPDEAVDMSAPPAEVVELENYEELETIQAHVPSQVPVRPAKRKLSPPPSTDAAQMKPQEKVPDRPERPTAAKPAPPVPKRADEPPPSPAEEKTNYINYANVYQALWDCAAGDKDELGFRRGDLIYIYEKPHADWWIGSLFKPQGYSVGLVPKDYVMEAYEFTAA